ncbi:putative PEP-binding protein [Chroococcidiopsis sp. CCMEE 29]|uniref:putative PEP-binding protein n=1 Tax=Chroococcidiopsis sp. CCMEE 29 TaxID=155894 RepID=UPI0020200D71|nr:putative PEP-binding protein [Chroococcidiopsis sp. CCMEE 29]
MDNLYWLEQIKPSDRTLVGEKAFHLSRVMQRGYPVLPGFVVPAQVLWDFLQTLNSREPLVTALPHSSLHLDVDNPHQLQQVAQRLCQEITTAPLPCEWVQSIFEATQSWEAPAMMFRPSLALSTPIPGRMKIAGLLEAQVCSCNRQAIALGLKRTWSQLFRARSLFYWQRHGIELQQINLAVLVQPLSKAIASGSLTCHRAEFEIKATWGLGMAIARGEVLPDSYFVQPETGAVRSQQLGNKTLAYCLANSPVEADFTPCLSILSQPDDNCLQTYLLSELQQQQCALNDKYLQQLIQLAQQLRTNLGSAFILEWTLSQSEDSVAPQLYITQVTNSHSGTGGFGSIPGLPTSSSFQPAPTLLTSQPSIRGLAAAGGQARATAYVIRPSHIPDTLPSRVILVAPAIALDWLPLLQQAAGIVTEQGGLTSHCAILARELGIPAVVSVANATQLLQTGESLLLDGDRGEIYRVSQSQDSRVRSEEYDQAHSSLLTSTVPIATQLLVNLSQPSLLERVKGLPVDGVGLVRSELMALTILQGQHPKMWLQQGRQAELIDLWQAQISQFASAFAPRPVFYRSLDWRSHEFQSLTDGSLLAASASSRETNPMLGQRGTFSYVKDSTMFELELAALAAVQQSGYTNLHLLLPFVRTVEEFSFCRRLVEQVGLTQAAQFQLWIMAEVPSILFLLPQYVKAGVQGISIGTNDLTQLLLGVDRDQGELAAAFDERHPVVTQAIAQIIQLARQANIPCSICGQAPALYPELIDSLVRWGITSISVEPEAVERTYVAIARAEQRLLLETARRQVNQIQEH